VATGCLPTRAGCRNRCDVAFRSVIIDPSTSRFLDAARWMAALAVVVSHTCAISLVAERQFVDQGFGVVLLSTLEYAGHLAVVVFFVISGYLVGGRELWRVRTGGKFDLGRYAVQRFSRIYTVLVPALLLAAALDAIGQHWANGSLLYTQPASANIGSLMFAIAKRSDIWTFFGNLLMLQTLVVKPLGRDGPLWSLANEWWYYTLFALIMMSASPHRRLLLRAVTLAAAGMLLKVLPTQMALWFSIWLLGVGLAVVGPLVPGLGFRTALALHGGGLRLIFVRDALDGHSAAPVHSADGRAPARGPANRSLVRGGVAERALLETRRERQAPRSPRGLLLYALRDTHAGADSARRASAR
jgi:peptidoglycan/LPS O-acetylase OafA/YrhL